MRAPRTAGVEVSLAGQRVGGVALQNGATPGETAAADDSALAAERNLADWLRRETDLRRAGRRVLRPTGASVIGHQTMTRNTDQATPVSDRPRGPPAMLAAFSTRRRARRKTGSAHASGKSPHLFAEEHDVAVPCPGAKPAVV